MKSLFVVLSLCVLSIHAQSNADSEADPHAVECMNELKLDSSSLDKSPDEFESNFTEDQRTCVLACMFRKHHPDKENLYELMASEIRKVENPRVTREQLTEKLNRCKNSVGYSDCKLMKCIELFKPPFSHYYLQD